VLQEIPYIEFKYVYADIGHVVYDAFTHAQRVPSWNLSLESCNTVRGHVLLLACSVGARVARPAIEERKI